MEARNQSVDDLLLEIDQSIAVSRHTMRYSLLVMTNKIQSSVISTNWIKYTACGFELITSGLPSVCMQNIFNSLVSFLGSWMEKVWKQWPRQTGIKFNFR